MLTVGNFTERLMRLGWFVPLFLLHSSYYWQAGGPPFLRFFICTFPLVIGSAFMLLEQIKIAPFFWREVDIAPLFHRLALCFLVLIVLAAQYPASQARMRSMVSNSKSQTRLDAGRMLTKAFGDVFFILFPTCLIIFKFISNKSSLDMPGFLGRPAVIITTSEFLVSS